jgi:hypothetical protein
MECQKDWEKLMKESNMDINHLEQNDFKDWQWLDKFFRKPKVDIITTHLEIFEDFTNTLSFWMKMKYS